MQNTLVIFRIDDPWIVLSHASLGSLSTTKLVNKDALHFIQPTQVYVTFGAAKKAIYFKGLARFLELPCGLKPIPIMQDSKPCIATVEVNALSTRVKHIAIPCQFTHEQIVHETIKMQYISTHLQPADPGTKPQSAPVNFRAYDYLIGVRHYPPSGSEHARLMELHRFNAACNFSASAKKQFEASELLSSATSSTIVNDPTTTTLSSSSPPKM